MLTELCQELKNWFDLDRKSGTFTITGGSLAVDFLLDGQYFRIKGSVFNDGVHQYQAHDLADETFTGEVWALAIPKEVVKLSEDIDAWTNKYETIDSAAMSPFNSESFGGYSYSKGTKLSSLTQANSSTGWKAIFASRMNMWRKL